MISSNRRRTTKYASDHNTRQLHQTGKPTLPATALATSLTEFSNPLSSGENVDPDRRFAQMIGGEIAGVFLDGSTAETRR